MKKILIALALLTPVFAFANSNETATNTKIKENSNLGTTTLTCVQVALEKRENALINGHDSFNTAIKSALTKRLSGLKDAWSQADRLSRVTKRQAAYKTFKIESQAAHNALRTVRNIAWKNFEAEAKACGINGSGESPSLISIPNSSL